MGLRQIHDAQEPKDQTCLLGRILDRLEGDDKAWLEEAIAGGVHGTVIAKVLTQGGYPIGQSSTYRHLRGDCLCR